MIWCKTEHRPEVSRAFFDAPLAREEVRCSALRRVWPPDPQFGVPRLLRGARISSLGFMLGGPEEVISDVGAGARRFARASFPHRRRRVARALTRLEGSRCFWNRRQKRRGDPQESCGLPCFSSFLIRCFVESGQQFATLGIRKRWALVQVRLDRTARTRMFMQSLA